MANWTAKPTTTSTAEPAGTIAECARIKAYFLAQLGTPSWPSDRLTQELIFEHFWGDVSREDPSRLDDHGGYSDEQVILMKIPVILRDVAALAAGRPCPGLGAVQRAKSGGVTPLADALAEWENRR